MMWRCSVYKRNAVIAILKFQLQIDNPTDDIPVMQSDGSFDTEDISWRSTQKNDGAGGAI
jgi:hypothetical protein